MLCPSDSDTTIMRTALETLSEQVTIWADDTEILDLLLHHVYFSNSKEKIYLKNIRVESSKDKIICYNIQDVIATNPKGPLEHLLFAHALTGCDTTSQIPNFGKISSSEN